MTKTDWDHWDKMTVASLAEVTMLSFDLEPTDEICHEGAFIEDIISYNLGGPRFKLDPQIKKRYSQAASAIGQEHGLVAQSHPRVEIPEQMPCVLLPQYGSWAKRTGIDLPSLFPIDLGQRISSIEGSVVIAMPFECEFMSELARIAYENFSNVDPNNPPKMVNIANDIKKAMPRINLRVATSLAAWIAPGAKMDKIEK